MPNSLTRTPVKQDNLNPSLLAFKPRQVVLANLDMKPTKPNKAPLLQAVAKFLESNGFSKTLKKFLSEAEIEKNGLKDSVLDLEEMYSKYSEICNNGGTSINTQKENGNEPAPEGDTKSKDMKKTKKSSDQDDEQLGAELKKPETEKKTKDKKKKKNKSIDDSVSHNAEQCDSEAKQDANGTSELIADENLVDVKPKGKKKKKENSVDKVLVTGEANESVLKKEDVKKSDVDAIGKKEIKGSKKRKRMDSGANEPEPVESKDDDESKRRKVEGLKESNGSEQEKSDATHGRAEEINKNLDKTAEKPQKSAKKQSNGSVEPKTVKAFQRVKVEEVVFTDEKLKDNSYWAKDGADTGYGAKAQEILGQVRGKDFRHEKTKKKRGTYRGGQIDLQSHSVKFNYSDED